MSELSDVMLMGGRYVVMCRECHVRGHIHKEDITNFIEQRESSLKSENEALWKVVGYAWHEFGCPGRSISGCGCGYDKALAELEKMKK